MAKNYKNCNHRVWYCVSRDCTLVVNSFLIASYVNRKIKSNVLMGSGFKFNYSILMEGDHVLLSNIIGGIDNFYNLLQWGEEVKNPPILPYVMCGTRLSLIFVTYVCEIRFVV